MTTENVTAENVTVAADVDATPASAPGGWKRVLLGLAVGLVAGAVLALLLPRDRRHDENREAEWALGSGDLDASRR